MSRKAVVCAAGVDEPPRAAAAHSRQFLPPARNGLPA